MLRELRHVVQSFLLLTLCAGCVSSSATPDERTQILATTCLSDVCVDDGFEVQRDGFSFRNWNEITDPHSSVDIPMLVTMFGHSVVCRPGPTDRCVPTPRALHLVDEWNTALTGGRCEGMAVLSERMFIDLSQLNQFDASIDTVAQLSRGNRELENEITYWWATQFTDDISAIARASREQKPSSIVQQLIHGLSTSAGYTLALYDHGMGHSLTPFAVSTIPDGWRISVYDNNFPGIDNHIDINAVTEQWTYHPRGSTNNASLTKTTRWSGSTGAIELTPMNARSGPFQCTSCHDQSGISRVSDDVVISLVPLSQHAEVGIEILTPDGTVSTLRSGPRIDGSLGAQVDITMSKDATAPRLTRVRVPSSLDSFDVRVIASSLTVSPPPVLLTVSQPGVASVHLRGMLARHQRKASQQTGNTPLLSVRSQGLRFSTDAATSASVAITADIADFDIQPGHSLFVDRRSTTSATTNVLIQDAGNNRVFSSSYELPDLQTTTKMQRHLLTYVNSTYQAIQVDIPAVSVPIDTSTNTTRRGVDNTQQFPTDGDTPTEIEQPASVENNESISAIVTPTTGTTESSQSTTPQQSIPSGPHIVTTLTASPDLLYVDHDDTSWLRVGNERSLVYVTSDGGVTRRQIDGIPIAVTQDDVGSYWALLQQPERLARITPTAITYYTHPRLNTPTSMVFSPRTRELLMTGGRNAGSYIASFSSDGSFDFISLVDIKRPDHLTLDAQLRQWFVDTEGGSISKIHDGPTVETFRRSTVMARSLTLGPDNAMWFVNNVTGQEIGRISAKGTYSFSGIPSGIDSLRGITSANGVLWLTARSAIIRMDTSRTLTIFPDTHAWGQSVIAAGPEHSLWFINSNFFTLSRITM